MVYLILCILSSAGIFVVFKVIENKKTDLLTAIISNYLTATIVGINLNFFTGNFSLQTLQPAIPSAIIIGVLFILMFFVVGLSTKHAGLTITTLASKMSVVFPIVISMLIDPTDHLTPAKTVAFILTLIGIALSVYKNPTKTPETKFQVFIPVLLFTGMGLVDSMVKFAQQYHVTSEKSAIFSTMVFFVAFLTGAIICFVRKKNPYVLFNWTNISPGIVLGIFNYGSIYFIIKALNHRIIQESSWLDSSVIFGLNNIGIVIITTLLGFFYFKENLLKINWIGIIISLSVIYFLSSV